MQKGAPSDELHGSFLFNYLTVDFSFSRVVRPGVDLARGVEPVRAPSLNQPSVTDVKKATPSPRWEAFEGDRLLFQRG